MKEKRIDRTETFNLSPPDTLVVHANGQAVRLEVKYQSTRRLDTTVTDEIERLKDEVRSLRREVIFWD